MWAAVCLFIASPVIVYFGLYLLLLGAQRLGR